MLLFNTWSRKKEEFKSVTPGIVKYYSCGPTVYSSSHLGHGVTYIRTDMLKQYLKNWKGYQVKHVQNITDFGHMTSDADEGVDKIKKAMEKEKKTSKEITDFYTKEFHDYMDELKIEKPDIEPKASECVDMMIELIEKIIDNGYAYESGGNVYFDVSKYDEYGKLSGKDMSEQEEKQRINDPNKKHPYDFVLWAGHQPTHSHVWDSPWGKGMPGWHLECSAMSTKYLGKEFDIHSGGSDHYFPHHENEIAQNFGAFQKHVVNYWVHFGMLLIDGVKMSKSKNNFVTLKEALNDFSPETIRMWTLSSHYKSTSDYSKENLEIAKDKLNKINNFIQDLLSISNSTEEKTEISEKYKEKFEKAMDDDLNTPEAIAVVFELITEANKKDLTEKEAGSILGLLNKMNKVFKFMDFSKTEITEDVQKILEEREIARQEKNWKKADELRDRIHDLGYIIQDTDQGPKLTKKN